MPPKKAKGKRKDTGTWVVAIIVAIISAISAIVVALIQQPSPSPTPQDYSGLVVDAKAQTPIYRAKVTLENLPNVQPVYTDSAGVFGFTLIVSDTASSVHFRIEADGYELYDHRKELPSDTGDLGKFELNPRPAPPPIIIILIGAAIVAAMVFIAVRKRN
jgi:hypothetical protein